MTEEPRYSWTQPSCPDCWNERNPSRQATRIKPEFSEFEQCVYCGTRTRSGIYVRIDPAAAPFPSLTK